MGRMYDRYFMTDEDRIKIRELLAKHMDVGPDHTLYAEGWSDQRISLAVGNKRITKEHIEKFRRMLYGNFKMPPKPEPAPAKQQDMFLSPPNPSSNTELTQRLALLESRLASADDIIRRLGVAVAEEREKRSYVENRLNELEGTLHAHQDRIAALSKTQAEHQAQMVNAAREINAIKLGQQYKVRT